MPKYAVLTAALTLVAVSFFGCDETKLTEPPATTDESVADAPLMSSANSSGMLPFWATGGNANTNPSSKFLGTVDNQSLAFRTNGVEAMRVTTDGRVGIGTVDPQTPLHVVNGTAFSEMTVEETRPGQAVQLNLKNTTGTWTLLSDADPNEFRIVGGGSPFTILGGSGYLGLGTSTPNYPLEMGSGAHVTVGGVWTNASSRANKENIRDLTVAEAQEALNGLAPVQFNYKADKDEDYVGFIAEDVPDLVATGDRKGLGPMDIVAVLTKVVQQQEERIAELEARLEALQ